LQHGHRKFQRYLQVFPKGNRRMDRRIDRQMGGNTLIW
jgi:hypothetical protein